MDSEPGLGLGPGSGSGSEYGTGCLGIWQVDSTQRSALR